LLLENLDGGDDGLADVVEDGHAFAGGNVGEILATPVVVSDGVARQFVLENDSALRNFPDAENHPTSLSDVEGGFQHGGQPPRSRVDHVEEEGRVFAVSRLHRQITTADHGRV